MIHDSRSILGRRGRPTELAERSIQSISVSANTVEREVGTIARFCVAHFSVAGRTSDVAFALGHAQANSTRVGFRVSPSADVSLCAFVVSM